MVNEDKMDKADIIIEEGKIVQVGSDLEVPSGMMRCGCPIIRRVFKIK